MQLTFEINDDQTKIKFNGIEKFSYDLKSEIDLTEYVQKISDLESEIELSPENYDQIANYDDLSKNIKKLLEYLYKIPQKFNEAFVEIQETDEEDA